MSKQARGCWKVSLAVALASVVLAGCGSSDSGISDDVTEAQKQYCDFARDLFAIDYTNWDSYFDRLKGRTSGEAKDTVEQSFVSPGIKDAVVASQVKQEVISVDCGVKEADGDRIGLIGYVVARTTNAQGTFPAQFVTLGEMSKVDGDWSITKLSLSGLNQS